MAKVNAMAQIVVNITKEDALNVLIEEFGFSRIFTPADNEYWELNEEENALLRFVDKSYHGTPNYEEDKNSRIINEEKVQLYKALLEISKNIKKEKL